MSCDCLNFGKKKRKKQLHKVKVNLGYQSNVDDSGMDPENGHLFSEQFRGP